MGQQNVQAEEVYWPRKIVSLQIWIILDMSTNYLYISNILKWSSIVLYLTCNPPLPCNADVLLELLAIVCRASVKVDREGWVRKGLPLHLAYRPPPLGRNLFLRRFVAIRRSFFEGVRIATRESAVQTAVLCCTFALLRKKNALSHTLLFFFTR